MNRSFKKILSKLLLNIIFPENSIIAKRKLIIVGFKYKKIGLSKKIVSPPNVAIRIAPTKGT